MDEMDELQLIIDTLLEVDTEKSKNEIKNNSIPTINKLLSSDKNARVKIAAGLDITKSKNLIQSQLATITNQANAPTIKVGVDVNDHKIGQNIVDGLQNVQTKAQKTVNQIKSSLLELTSEKIRKIQFDIGADEEGFFNFQKTIENAKSAISEIGNFKNVDISWGLNKETGEIEKIVTTITDARGVTESFIYDLQKLGNAFSYAGGSGTDKGVQALIEVQRKHSQEIENTRAKYTRLFEDFKNSNSAIESGLTEPIEKFQAILDGLGSTSSISDVKNEFESLKKAASEINKYLDTTNNSFNKSTNAINHYKNMDNIIKDLSISFDNLSTKPQDLSTKIDTVKTHLIELQKLEAQNGTDLSWAEKYREVNLELSEIETRIKLAQKAEKSDKNSSYQVQSKYLAKIKDEISTIVGYKKKLVSAGEEEVQVYQREIDLALKRIGYAESQLKKKNLLTDEAKAYINTLKNELTIQEKINVAKTNDKANSQFQNDFNKYSQDLQRQIDTLNRLYNSPIFNNNSSNNAVISQRQRISELLVEYNELKSKLSSDIDPKGLESIGISLNKLKTYFDIVEDETNQLKTSLTRSVGDEKLRQNIDGLTARINVFRQSNSKAEKQFGSVFDGMLADLKECGDSDTYRRINKQFQIIQDTVKATGKTGKTFWERLKEQAEKFSSWMSLTGLLTSTWHEIQKMVTNVIELDSAMTNLKKVTDETETSYARFLKNTSQQAKDLKIDLSDLVNQTAEWSKKGYSMAESGILSKSSGIYSVVGEVDNTTAVQDLTTVMKSYNMTVEEAIDIVDRFNNISNKYSVSAADIGEMLSNSISSLSIAGNSLDQAIAMGTTITEITGDASEAGNTLKVLSMRLRGASTEIENIGESTDGMAESTAKLREKILALTNVNGKGGFDIMADDDSFKSTYEIMKGISEVWQDISDVNQAALIELIAGKQRGNTVSALLTNMAQANNILNDSLNSSGSAMGEYELYLESIEGRIQGFKTSFESLSNTVVDSDLVKGIVDIGTGILNFLDGTIDKLGTIPTLLTAISARMAFKNVGELLNTPVYAQPQLICA